MRISKSVFSSLKALIGILPILVGFQNCGPGFEIGDSEYFSKSEFASSVEGLRERLEIAAKPCDAGHVCEVAIFSEQALSLDITADWATNDEAWRFDPGATGRPGYHYVSAAGKFAIYRGESETRVRVNSINWQNNSSGVMTMRIPITIRNCAADGRAISCSVLLGRN